MMKIPALFVLFFVCIPLLAQAEDEYAGFPTPQANFQAHIEEVEQYLLRTQMSQRNAAAVQLNIPFERTASPMVNYRGRFLLIHGLNDSAYAFNDVADALTQRGFDVRAILLPGHGNSPAAQLNMTHKRWLASARLQLSFWNEQSTAPLYLGGFSMGAVIATILALENDEVGGLLLFSPAYKSRMNHLLRWSSIYARFKPWMFGGMIIEDNPTKYNSIPINGAAQYYKLTKTLRRSWRGRSLDMPVFAVASSDDSVVDIEFLIRVFKNRFTSENKQLIVYTNNEDEIDIASIVYRSSAYPEKRIINQSHQGVLMSSANPLFGEDGSVLVCNGNDWPTFSGCLYSRENHWFGAQHTPSPDDIPVARTTYNPDFEFMFEKFDSVFGTDQ